MRTFRRAVFWCLALVYVIVCPLLIVNTLGYRHTGLIVIEAQPDDASVIISGRRVAHKTPATIPHLSPGRYTVRIERDGYLPWTRDVFVESGQASILDHLFLLPHPDAMKMLTQESFDSLRPIDGTPYIVLQTGNRAADAHVFNGERETLVPLVPTNAPYASRSIREIFTMPGSPDVLVQIGDDKQDRYLWVHLDQAPTTSEDITPLIPKVPSEVLWSTDAPEWLFCFQNGSVNKVDVKLGTNQLNFASEWLGLGVFDDSVCGLDTKARFVKTTLAGELIGTEATALDLDRGLFKSLGFIRIIPMANDALLFHESGGRLLQTEQPHLLVEKAVEGVRLSTNATHALVWHPHALGVLEQPSQQDAKEAVFAAGRHIRWVYEGKKKVTSAYFMYGETYALCQLDDVVTVFDLQTGKVTGEDPREAYPVRRGTAIHYDDGTGMLYALDPETARLIAIRMLPNEHDLDRRMPSFQTQNQGGAE